HVGEDHVRRGGAHDDEVDVRGLYAGGCHGGPGCLLGQVRGGLPFGSDVPALDAGPGADPLVGGIHHGFQLRVVEDALGQVPAGAGNAGIQGRDHHWTCEAGAAWLASRVRIWSGTRFSASTTATSRACWKASSSAPPWLLMT